MKKYILICLFTFIAATGAVWSEGKKDIVEVQDHPRDYVGTIVGIQGEVIKVTPVIFTDFFIQTVYDRTGTMPVITMVSREIGDSFNSSVHILGLNTQGAEGSTEKWVSDLAQFMLEQQWMTLEEAEKLARNMHKVMMTLFRGMDISLMGIEKETAGASSSGTSI